MTCVVGYIDSENNKVFMGGDSAGVSENFNLTVRTDGKVFKNGDFIFGFTDSFRMGQILKYSFVPPTPKDDEDIHAFMCTKFVNALRECFVEGGFAKIEDTTFEVGGTFLVGYKGMLFEIYDDYQVGIPIDGFSAVGCGGDVAKGALHAIKSIKFDTPPLAKDVVFIALQASERNNAGVRSPFVVIDEDGKIY